LLNFRVEIEEEAEVILLLASVFLYDHLFIWLCRYYMKKEIIEFEEVTGVLLSHETRRKSVNDQANEDR
jgi:hypothetical protein